MRHAKNYQQYKKKLDQKLVRKIKQSPSLSTRETTPRGKQVLEYDADNANREHFFFF